MNKKCNTVKGQIFNFSIEKLSKIMCGGALETKMKWIQEKMGPGGVHSPTTPPPPMSKFGFKFEIVVVGH